MPTNTAQQTQTTAGAAAGAAAAMVTCPKCKSKFPLTEAIAGPMLDQARAQFDIELRKKENEIRQAAADEAATTSLALINEYQDKAEQAINAREAMEGKLAVAQKAQADAIAKERSLIEKERELDLTIERRTSEAQSSIRAAVQRELEASLGLRVTERDETINVLKRELGELQQRIESGSGRDRGEAQEVALEDLLRKRFLLDRIEAIGKGQAGGDLLQTICTAGGAVLGSILWESKRTKNWSDGWLGKAKEDQRRANADVAIIVSQAMPRNAQGVEVTTVEMIEDVWVCRWDFALAIALTARCGIADVCRARRAADGQESKAVQVYQYLNGPKFQARVKTIVERLTELTLDLQTERKQVTRMWARREEQTLRAIEAAAGMAGDLEGIASGLKGVGEAAGLTLKLTEGEG